MIEVTSKPSNQIAFIFEDKIFGLVENELGTVLLITGGAQFVVGESKDEILRKINSHHKEASNG